MEPENHHRNVRQSMVGELLQSKRKSVDHLTESIANYNEILEFVRTPALLHHMNGLIAWLIRFVAMILGLASILTSLLLFFSKAWPDSWWQTLLANETLVGNEPVAEVKLEMMLVFVFFGLITMIIGLLLITLSWLIGSVRNRSKTIRDLSMVITEMLSHEKDFLESEKNAYLNLSKELDNWT